MKMKKIRHIFLLGLACLTLPACIQEILPLESAPEVPDGKVVIEGSLIIPAVEDSGLLTKAFGEPDVVPVQRLYVAVFDDSDILYEVAAAEPGSLADHDVAFTCGDESSGYLTPFYVKLTEETQDVRYIHFIAVSEPNDVLERAVRGNFDAVDEAAFVQKLVTSGGDIAYWGRRQVTSITRYMSTYFQGIQMIRNFAKVKVSLAQGVNNFTLLGFRVFDAPDRGAIAPFNNSTSDYSTSGSGLVQINFNRFANYSQAANLAEQNNHTPYTFLTRDDGYHGYMPLDYQYDPLSTSYGIDTDPGDDFWVQPAAADYLYECSYRPDRNPFIILKGIYGGQTYYYKADFVYENQDAHVTEYYDILRNFQYTFNITSVSGKGSDHVYDAVNSIALNNLQGSTLARSLTSIASDNSQLFVSTTQKLITSGTTFTMYVKSVTAEGNEPDDTEEVTAEVLTSSGGGSILTSEVSISSSPETTGPYASWHKVTFGVTDAETLKPGEVWKQSIVFKNPSGLVRILDLTLRRPLAMKVDVTDFVPNAQDSPCEVKMSIPAGIADFNFPLYFYIEQEENTLYPEALAAGSTAALNVESGRTKIPGNGTGNTYYYRRAITWDEYRAATTDVNGIKTFTSRFKSLKAASATTVWVIPAEENDYFKVFDDVENLYTNQDSFVNNKFTPTVTFPYYGLQLPVTTQVWNSTTSSYDNVPVSAIVAASTDSDGAITYTSSNTNVATVDASGKVTTTGTGTTTITATASATDSYATASANYTLQVVAANESCGLELNWKPEPPHVLEVGKPSVNVQAAVTVVQGYDPSNVTVAYSIDSSTPASVVTLTQQQGVAVITAANAGTVRLKATATAAAAGGKAATARSIYFDIQVVSAGGHPEPGSLYHSETFLGPTLGDYTILDEVVTDGATYDVGTNKTTDFNRLTTFNVGTGYDPRHVWYAYYNKSSMTGFGAAASGYGAIEEPTSYYNPDTDKWTTDYHNKNYASHTRLASKTIDLSASSGATLIFEHAGNYFYNNVDRRDIANAETIMRGDAKVFISKNGGSSWEEATVTHYPSGDSWVFERASVNIPSDYLVSSFRLLFDYKSIGGTEIPKTKKVDGVNCPLYHPRETYVENQVQKTRLLTLELTAEDLYKWHAEKQAAEWAAAWDAEHVGEEKTAQEIKEKASEILDGFTPEQKAAFVNEAEAVMISNPDAPGRAGTWEIRNVQIKERRFYD